MSRARMMPCRGVAVLGAALSSVAASPAFAQDLPGRTSNPEDLPSGSLVIPMDNTHQVLVAPFNVAAYGLVNELLQNQIAVKWVVATGKAKDGIDFSATAARVKPTAQAAALRDFRAGPFVVHEAYAALALPLITAFGNSVAVYELTQDVTVDVLYTLIFKPLIAVNTQNSAIHTDILDLAGIPDYDVINDFDLLSGSCYTLFTEPHNGNAAGVDAVQAFVQSGGNFIAQCASVETYENNTTGGYISTLGIKNDNKNNALDYPNPDLSFSQIEGTLAPSPGGSFEDWKLDTGSTLKANAHIHADNIGAAVPTWQATAQKEYFGGRGGMVYFLGGHEYGHANLADQNGERMFLNAVMTPPTRPSSCNLDFGIPDIELAKSHTGTFYAGGTGTYTITATNAGSDTTLAAVTVVDSLPAGLGYSSASGAGWAFGVSGQVVTATYAGTIPPGGAPSFTLTVTVDASAAPGVTNVAYASTAGDMDDTYDVASDSTSVAILDIVKRAYQLDGTAIANAEILPSGALFKFLLYINNPGGALADVSMHDVLDPAFVYLAGSIETANSTNACALETCTPAEEATIFADADSGAPASDAIDADAVSIAGTNLYAGNQSVANARLDLAAGKVYALVFTVRLD